MQSSHSLALQSILLRLIAVASEEATSTLRYLCTSTRRQLEEVLKYMVVLSFD